DSAGNTKVNASYVVLVDNSVNYTTNLTSPASGASYVPGASYIFNITWEDITDVRDVVFQMDGSNKSYQGGAVTRFGTGQRANYTITLADLGANETGWLYRWDANDTNNIRNATPLIQFIIYRAHTNISLQMNGTQADRSYNITDHINFTTLLNVSGKAVQIWSNLSGVMQLLAAGTAPLEHINFTDSYKADNYTAIVNWTGDTNYTADSEVVIIRLYAKTLNVPPSLKAALQDDTSLALNTSGFQGVRPVLIGVGALGNGNYSARLYLNYTTNIDLSGIIANVSVAEGKGLISNFSGVANIVNKSLLIPKVRGTGAVYICPHATALEHINTSCPGMFPLTPDDMREGVNFTDTLTIDGQAYYLIANVTGTGGQEANATNITFVAPTPDQAANISWNWSYANTSINSTFNTSGFIDWNRSLVLYLDFQEGAGGYANDTSTWSNNGSLNGFPCLTLNCDPISGWNSSGRYGRTIVFDGIDNYVNVSDSDSLDVAGPITITFWMRTRNRHDIGAIVSKGESLCCAAQGPYSVAINSDGQLYFDLGNGTYRQSLSFNYSAQASPMEWHFIAAVWNGSNGTAAQKIYMDSVLNTTGNVPAGFNSLEIGINPVMIGADNRTSGASTRFFNGSIDEVRIWNRALSEAEINASYTAKQYGLQGNFTNLTDGNYDYYAYVVDEAGNYSRTPDTGFRTLTVDTVVPSVTNPQANITGAIRLTRSIRINVTASDTLSLVKTVNAGAQINNVSMTYTGSGNFWEVNTTPELLGCPAVDGNCSVTFNATDFAGNSNATEKLNISLDATAPNAFVFLPSTTANNSNTSQNWVYVNVTFIEANVDTCVVAVTGAITQNTTLGAANTTSGNSRLCSFNLTGLSTEGAYTVQMYANDTVSNLGASPALTYRFDTLTPNLDLVAPTPADAENRSLNWAFVNLTSAGANSSSGFVDWNYSLAGYWRFQEGYSSSAGDSSTYGNNGSLVGFGCTDIDCNQSSGWTAYGKFGRGIIFDGQNDHVTIPNSTTTRTHANFTIEAWILKRSSVAGRFLSKANATLANGEGYYFGVGSDERLNFTLFNSANSLRNLAGTTVLSNGTWHHAAVAYNGSGITLYLDGLVEATLPSTSGYAPANGINFTIGADSPTLGTGFFNGSVDEVRLWNRTLSGQEINASFNAAANALRNNFTMLADGKYEYYAYITDEAGNTNRTPSAGFRTLTVDTVMPTVSNQQVNVTTPVRSSFALRFNVTVTDATSGVFNVTLGTLPTQVKMISIGSNVYELNATLTSLGCSAGTEANCSLTVNATDFASNSNTDGKTNVTIDDLGPNSFTFNGSTLANNTVVFGNNQMLNLTITDLFSSIDTCLLELDNSTSVVNYSMTKSGSGLSVTCANLSIATNDGVTYKYRVWANDSLGNLNASVQRQFTENSLPSVTGPAAGNKPQLTPAPTATAEDNLAANVTARDSENTTLRIYFTWYRQGVLNFSGVYDNFVNGSNTNISIVYSGNFTKGTNWSISVIPSDGFENGTEAFSDNTTIVNTAPRVGDLKENPADPATYKANQVYYFNITVIDRDGISDISDVIFEFNNVNTTVTAYNRTINTTAAEYYTNKTDLAAATYNYRWIVNDTFPTINATSWTYTVDKAPSGIALYLNGTRANKGYLNNSAANFTAVNQNGSFEVGMWWTYSDQVIRLLNNGSSRVVNITQLIVTGKFQLIANWSGNENYTADNETWNFTVGSPIVQPAQMLLGNLSPANPFEPGEKVVIRANVTHPAGNTELAAVWFNLSYPNGTLALTNVLMANVSDITIDEFTGYTYEYNITWLGLTKGYTGNYTVNVTANDTNAARGSNTSFFHVNQSHIIVRQWAQTLSYNNTHLNVTLTVFVFNNDSRILRTVEVLPDVNFSALGYNITDLRPGNYNETNFTLLIRRPSNTDDNFTINAATLRRGGNGTSNTIFLINPIDPVCKTQINVTFDVTPSDPSENITPFFNGTAQAGIGCRTIDFVWYKLDDRANVTVVCQDGLCDEDTEQFNFTLTRAELTATNIGLLGNHTVRVYANNSNGGEGNRNYTWLIHDITKPSIRNANASNNTIIQRDKVNLTAEGYDLISLAYAVLPTNESGQWVNHSGNYGSPMPLFANDTFTWSNFTWQNASTKGTLYWQIFYNDTSGNANGTGLQTLTVLPIYLDTNLTGPPANTTVTQNRTFRVNASVVCRRGDCGNVTARLQYNASGPNPDTTVSASQGATPFYAMPGYANPVNCSGNPLSNAQACDVGWRVNASGDINTGWLLNVRFSSNYSEIDANTTDNFSIRIVDCVLDLNFQFDGIEFGVWQPGNNSIPALRNNVSGYNITLEEPSCNLDFYVKGAHLEHENDSAYRIGIGNVSWNHTFQDALTPIALDYGVMRKNVQWGTNLSTSYFINVPKGILYGGYNGTITILGNRSLG
ncbi:MAG: LamG domain-containing protein, partial [Candidatus Aenigmarchaeota archaeon]|nr:LamG domain-containing protein [Candidatus Aenigmarchaeota archaeon]